MKSLPRSLFNVNVTDSAFKEINQEYHRMLDDKKVILTKAVELIPDCIEGVCRFFSKHNVTDMVSAQKLRNVLDDFYNNQDFLTCMKYAGGNFDNKFDSLSFDLVIHPNLMAGFHSDVKITTKQSHCDKSPYTITFHDDINIISIENGTIVTTHYDEMTMCITDYRQIQQYEQLSRFEENTFDASLAQMVLDFCTDQLG